MMIDKQWHTIDIPTLEQELKTNLTTGLSTADIPARQALHGPNELKETGGVSPLKLLISQFTNTMVLILIAAVISGP